MNLQSQKRLLIVVSIGIIIPIVCIAGPYPKPSSYLSVYEMGNSVELSWNPVAEDIYGNGIDISHYNVYRGSDPYFIPDTVNGTNRIGQNNDPSYFDINALLTHESYYYYVTTVSSDGTESLNTTNVGYKIRHSFVYNPDKPNKHWISLPYDANIGMAQVIASKAPTISKVIRWDPLTQTEQIWDQESQTGINFNITPGEAYAITITGDTVINFVGSHADHPVETTYNADNFNTNWLSLPFPNAYKTASILAQNIGDTTKIGKYDNQENTYISWFYLDGNWMGNDFELLPGEGVLAVITADTSWRPSIGLPEVEAIVDITRCLNYNEISMWAIVTDYNGSLVSYDWDFEGDGIFDYSSSLSPDTLVKYNTAGVYYPTLLVTDNDGYKNYHFGTVEVYGLDNEISVEEFNAFAGETVQFTYTISNNGYITINIYDGDNNLIRIVTLDQLVGPGQHQIIWDGHNELGELVDDGTYYIVFEYTVDGTTYTRDWRTSTGGCNITNEIENTSVSGILSPLEGEYVNILYTLVQKALVTIDINAQDGTTIRHLLISAPRSAGNHTEIWDGADDNGNIVSPNTVFYVDITVESLSDNAIITSGNFPEISDISASPIRFSPATNPYGIRDNRDIEINFSLNKPADATATVHNSNGTIIRRITEENLPAGENQISWNGRNDSGVLMSDGKYIIRLTAKDSNDVDSNSFYIQSEIFY